MERSPRLDCYNALVDESLIVRFPTMVLDYLKALERAQASTHAQVVAPSKSRRYSLPVILL